MEKTERNKRSKEIQQGRESGQRRGGKEEGKKGG